MNAEDAPPPMFSRDTIRAAFWWGLLGIFVHFPPGRVTLAQTFWEWGTWLILSLFAIGVTLRSILMLADLHQKLRKKDDLPRARARFVKK